MDGGEVSVAVISNSSLPDAEQDANPTVSEFSQRGMVFHAAAALEAVIGAAPGTPLARVVGEFVKGLPEKFRASVSPMHMARLAALLGDRRNAGAPL